MTQNVVLHATTDWLRSVLLFFCGPSSGHGGCLLGLVALAAPPYHTFRGEHVGPSTPLRGGWSSYLGAGPKQGAKQSIDHARSPHHKSLKIGASMGGATPFFLFFSGHHAQSQPSEQASVSTSCLLSTTSNVNPPKPSPKSGDPFLQGTGKCGGHHRGY